MKIKDRYNISKSYENLFSFRDEKDELDFEAHMLMFRFLSEVEKISVGGKLIKNKELASKLGFSSSYITQLFNGDKLLNFTMLAKIQKAYNITFEIKAKKNEQSHTSKSTEKMSHASLHVNQLSEENPDYKKSI
jgi:transcriptional regulator with XRE-family HTH domain